MAPQNNKGKLNTGAEIPLLGFGTWQDADAQYDAVTIALKAGYKHIDTARVYGTEPAVGKAIKESSIPRSDLFLTTKLWNHQHHPDDVEKALDESLADLGTDYVDLYLMHWPQAFKRGSNLFPKDSDDKMAQGDTDYVDTWKAMEKLPKSKVRAIGISNFNKEELERVLKEGSIVPAAHQLELHAWLQQKEFIKFNESKGIHLTAYSPFGNSNETYDSQHLGLLIEDSTLVEIGKKYGKSGAQVALAWGVSKGYSVLPKSKTEQRIKDNLEGDFVLEKEDLSKIEGLDKKLRFNNPTEGFGRSFYDGLDGK